MLANDIIEGELARVREWARHQLAHGEEQPWSSFLLTRLNETIDALLAGMAATRAIDAEHKGARAGLRLMAAREDPYLDCEAASLSASRARAAEPVG
jgi:hypothetical protein